MWILLVLISAGFEPSAWSQERTRAQVEREAAFQSRMATPEYKRAVIKADLLERTSKAYDQNPKIFVQYTSTRDRDIPRQLSKPQALEIARRRIHESIDGWDIQNEPLAQVLNATAEALPFGMGGILQGAMKLVPASPGHIPDVSPNELARMGADALNRSQTADATGNMIREILVRDAKFDPRGDVSPSDPAVVALRREEALLRERIVGKQRHEQTTAALNRTEKAVNEIVDDLRERRRRELDESRYQKSKERLVGSANAAGYALQLLGANEAAAQVFQVRDILTSVIDLNRNAAAMDPMMLAGGYMGVAVAVGGMLKKGGPSAEQKMLKQLLEMVHKLRVEMHERFDRVDQSIAKVLLNQIQNQRDLTSSLTHLHSANEELRLQLIDFATTLENRFTDAAHSDRERVLSRCRYYPESLSARETEECFRSFGYEGTIDSRSDLFTRKPIGAASTRLPIFPFGYSVAEIAHQVARAGGTDLYSMLAPASAQRESHSHLDLANPEIWYQTAGQFLQFSRRFSAKPRIASRALQDFELSGEVLDRFYRGVGFDSEGRPRRSVVESILGRYERSLLNAFDLADREIYTVRPYSPDTLHLGQIHVGKNGDESLVGFEPRYFKAPSEYQVAGQADTKLRWCDGRANLRVVGPDLSFATSLQAAVGDPESKGFTLQAGTHRQVSPLAKRLEFLNLGTLEFCLDTMRIEVLARDRPRPVERCRGGREGPGICTNEYGRENLYYQSQVSLKVRLRADPKKDAAIVDVQRLTVATPWHVTYHDQSFGLPRSLPSFFTELWTHGSERELRTGKGVPVRLALTRADQVRSEDLFDANANADLLKEADQRLGRLQSEQIQKLLTEATEVRQETRKAQEASELVQIIYDLGLRSAMTPDQQREWSQQFNSLQPMDVAYAVIQEGQSREEFLKRLERHRSGLLGLLEALDASGAKPRGSPLITKRIKELRAASGR